MNDARARFPASADAVAHVFVDVLGDEVEVEGHDTHHLVRVRRLRAGERITGADGAGSWRLYEIVHAARDRLVLEARSAVAVEPEMVPAVDVAFALQKNKMYDTVAALTELGVRRIEPVRASRSVVRWDDARAAGAVARMRTVAREAAAQCRRARLVEVTEVTDLADLAARRGLVVAERDGDAPHVVALPAAAAWTVVVGPEGGFAPEERALLGGPRLAIGPYVLRAETAPIAAAAALIGRAGWSDPA